MHLSSQACIRDAVILAAGNGDRFAASPYHSKLLHPVLGRPLILRTLDAVAAAGMSAATLVVGYEADRVRAIVERHAPSGMTLQFAYNADWHLENGVSALKAREGCAAARFALLMADHLFESQLLTTLVRHVCPPGDCLLAIDPRVDDPVILSEATRVQMEGDRIVAIGKGLEPWDAVDTGLFVFTPAIFDALETAIAEGETTLSAGVQRLAARGLMRGVAIGRGSWCDVDTAADLETAETIFSYGTTIAERA